MRCRLPTLLGVVAHLPAACAGRSSPVFLSADTTNPLKLIYKGLAGGSAVV